MSSGIEIVRISGGKVENSKLGYLFKSFDALVGLKKTDWARISGDVRRDRDLYERSVGKLEDYVSKIYEGS